MHNVYSFENLVKDVLKRCYEKSTGRKDSSYLGLLIYFVKGCLSVGRICFVWDSRPFADSRVLMLLWLLETLLMEDTGNQGIWIGYIFVFVFLSSFGLECAGELIFPLKGVLVT